MIASHYSLEMFPGLSTGRGNAHGVLWSPETEMDLGVEGEQGA